MQKSIQAMKKHSLMLQAMRDIFCRYITALFPQVFMTITRLDFYEQEGIAKVYISFLRNEEPTIASIIAHLNHNQPMIRGRLGKRLASKLRTIPKLSFYRESALDEAFHVQNLLKEKDITAPAALE